MQKDGKYVYCIIATDCDSSFASAGIGEPGNLVTTIGYEGLCMVVSNHPLSGLALKSENILAHQKVIEEVMKEYNSVIPVRFGAIAASPDEIRNLLARRYSEFSDLLKCFENKVELNIRATWKNMPEIYKEIKKGNPELRNIRKRVNKLEESELKKNEIVGAGILVEKALMQKKEYESEIIIDMFRKLVFEHKQIKTNGDEMFMNTAFLVNSGREVEIDNIMSDIGQQYQNRCDFVYTFPLPIFNFVNLSIFPEAWET
ncbi:MAG: GvpL/GvpF family gas vesicle protein [Ignavibacteriae bacterium]|nr:GvpL/GvpF family gas vesicle protein [Ignavibacteriota bacterium]